VNGGANLFPRLYTALYEAARRVDRQRMALLHEQVLKVGSGLYRIGAHSSAIIKGIKCGLSCLEVCDDFMAEPARRFREPERQRVAAATERLAAEVAALDLGDRASDPA
jgi:4-hydroxy-tetrahydrodipicolinate synthase